MRDAVSIIRQEHRYIAAVVHCLEHVLKDIRAEKIEVQPEFFRAVVEYIRDFPDRFHHPKEDDYLFKAVARRRPDLKPVLDELSGQHRAGERKIAALLWKAEAFEKKGQAAFDPFCEAALEYVDFQRAHLLLEEDKIIPAALESLTDDDWAEIDAAFADNDDPIFGSDPKRHFQAVISEIVHRAPAPHGVADRKGPALEAPERDRLRRWL